MANHTCASCEKPFTAPRLGVRFCSRDCYYVARRKRVSSVADRFWAKVQKGADGECWAWTGAKHKYGYGRMSVGSPGDWRVTEAHRVSYELHRGPIPDGLFVCHRCDNPPCCNPDHLFLGTNDDNRQDSVRKGRHPKGERVRRARLDADSVREMRRLYGSGELDLAGTAARFRVHQATAWDAITRRTWKHVG